MELEDDLNTENNKVRKKRGYQEANFDSKDLEDIESKLKRLKIPSTNKKESLFEIRIKSVSGQIYQIKVDGEELVMSLKNKLESCVGTPFAQIRLIYNGRVMADLHSLNHYKITESSVIHMVYALRGGFQSPNLIDVYKNDHSI